MAEINTDNLVLALLTGGGKGYPVTADTKNENDIVWYQQNSYTAGTCENTTLTKLFKKASKSRKGKAGMAEFVIDTPDFYIVIEDKDDQTETMFSGYSDISEYINNGYDISRLYKCPIDDVLWYAEHLKSEKDVIAIANFSNGKPESFQSATFFFPKGGNIKDIKILCTGNYTKALLPLSEYKSRIAELKGELKHSKEQVYDDLRKYAETSSKFFRQVDVADSERLGLVSIVALALTNKKSDLYKKVIDDKQIHFISIEDIKNALLEDKDRTKYGVITDPKKGVPVDKIGTLKEYIDGILKSYLTVCNEKDLNGWDKIDKSNEKFFNKGPNTILSRTTYSIYNNIIATYDKYKDKGIDVMGTFYSLFLVYYASDKKKGIVLTPNHITTLFCDIAKYFRGKDIDKNTTIMDICTGSGGFLISALNYIDKSIDEDNFLNKQRKDIEKNEARKNCLIGVEKEPSMFVLAYANMSFHGDGSSRLYKLNGLESYPNDDDTNFGAELCKLYDPDRKIREDLYNQLQDTVKHEKESDETYRKRVCNIVVDELFKQKGADIGMINPPYGKGYNQFDFINAELKYLKKGGIGIAIVPVSNQGASKNADKEKILENHTLLASILMPTQLFINIRNSGASVGTCILVFRAHIPHQNFLSDNGKTFLADWREDGFKMVNKHGRFEDKDRWYMKNTGYHDLYLSDMKKTIEGDIDKQVILDNAYKSAFPDEKCSHATMIPSSLFLKDIHNGGIKSISVRIFDNPHTIERQKVDQNGNLKWKMQKVKGQETYKLDENGEKIPDTQTIKVWDNMDWNILDYVKTEYKNLTDDNFINTMRKYKLFQYMLDNNMLFSDEEIDEEDEN